MAVYLITNTLDWNQLCNKINDGTVVLTSSDKITCLTRLDFVSGVIMPLTLNVGPASFCGLGLSASSDATITIASGPTPNILFQLAGGQIDGVKVLFLSIGTRTLLADNSYGTVSNIMVDGFSGTVGTGVLMTNFTVSETLNLLRVYIASVSRETILSRGLISVISAGTVNLTDFAINAASNGSSGLVFRTVSGNAVLNVTRGIVEQRVNNIGNCFGTLSTSGAVSISEVLATCNVSVQWGLVGTAASVTAPAAISNCVVQTVGSNAYICQSANSNVTFTNCLLMKQNTSLSSAFTLGGHLVNCYASTNTTATPTSGSLTTSNLYSASQTVSNMNLSGSIWSNSSAVCPQLLNLFSSQSSFLVSNYASTFGFATIVNPTGQSSTRAVALPVLTASPTNNGESSLTDDGRATFTITSVEDWAALSAVAPLVSNQKILLATNLTFVTMPNTLNINDGRFDGMGYTITLLFGVAGFTASLFTVAGGRVGNVNIDTTKFLSYNATPQAVTATTDSYGSFSNIRVTGNCLMGAIVLNVPADASTSITHCSFTGDIVANNAGGIFNTNSTDAQTTTLSSGVSNTFNCTGCVSSVRLYGTSGQAAIGYTLAGPADATASPVAQLNRCAGRVTSTLSLTINPSSLLAVQSGGTVQECYGLGTLSNANLIELFNAPLSNIAVIRDCYFVFSDGTACTFVHTVANKGGALNSCYLDDRTGSLTSAFVNSNASSATLACAQLFSNAPTFITSNSGTVTGIVAPTSLSTIFGSSGGMLISAG